MRGKKVIGLIFLLVLNLLIAGCAGSGALKGGGEIEQQEIYTGTGAVDVSFVQETLPNFEVDPGYPFVPSIEIVNNGAYPVENGKVILDGLSGAGTITFTAGGKTEYQKEPIPERKTFSPITIQNQESFLLTACYKYKTWMKGTLCYDPDVKGTSTLTKACDFSQSHSFADGQGAPIAITNMEIRRKGDGSKADIVIRISNLGGGKVRTPTNPTIDCDGTTEVKYEHQDRIRISKLTFNKAHLTCSQPQPDQGLIPIYGGSVVLTCEATNMIGNGKARTVPFEIELEYGYVTQSSRQTIYVQQTQNTFT